MERTASLCLIQTMLTVFSCIPSFIAAADVNFCGACRLIVDELEAEISMADPKKKVRVGSFRVDPQGNQKLDEVLPYGRSEGFINDHIDSVCDKVKDYVLAQYPNKPGALTWQRTNDRAGRPYKHTPRLFESTTKLRAACDDIIDEHADSITKFLSKSLEDPVSQFCGQETDYCHQSMLLPYPLEVVDIPPPEPTVNEEDGGVSDGRDDGFDSSEIGETDHDIDEL